MIPSGSGLRTDSTMIRYGGHWGRLKRDLLARFGWRPHPVGATPMAPSLIKCCYRCFDKSPAGDHKTTLTLFGSLCLRLAPFLRGSIMLWQVGITH
ncbi:hypothetical protein JCM39194_16010 [Desulfotomaculum varum]